MKLLKQYHLRLNLPAATFGWLCVETKIEDNGDINGSQAATFGWLCVETLDSLETILELIAATFGWLCVETSSANNTEVTKPAATFGWLCVETSMN